MRFFIEHRNVLLRRSGAFFLPKERAAGVVSGKSVSNLFTCMTAQNLLPMLGLVIYYKMVWINQTIP